MLVNRVLPAEPIASLDEYRAAGGGRALARAREIGLDGAIQLLKAAGLRGRGGAGYPTWRKWASMREGGPEIGRHFVVANGAEGEPGTFKDRPLMRRNPYRVIEGLSVAAQVVDAEQAFIAVKRSFVDEIGALERAMKEMAVAGLLCDAPISLVAGPEEYLFGEEKGLLQVIEGDDALPGNFPPYMYGLFSSRPQFGWSANPELAPSGEPDEPQSNPTLVQNVESLAHVTMILENGSDWFRENGTAESPGTVIVSVVGDVVRAGYGELPMGTPLGDAIEQISGGARPGRRIRAVLSGVANPVLTAEQLGTPLTYEGFLAAGSGLGSCGFIVYDDATDMVAAALSASQFLSVESCGQCPACKFGSGEVTAYLTRLASNRGEVHDVELIGARLRTVNDANRCYLGTEEQRVISSFLRAFPEDFAEHIERRLPPVGVLPIPKIVDIADGEARYDARQMRKRPDWTYADE